MTPVYAYVCTLYINLREGDNKGKIIKCKKNEKKKAWVKSKQTQAGI